jgi:hypothetical protein
MAEEVMTMEFEDDFKKELINIIKQSLKGTKLTEREVTILFNWVRHQTDPAFEFVPMKYRTIKVPTKKKGRN